MIDCLTPPVNHIVVSLSPVAEQSLEPLLSTSSPSDYLYHNILISNFMMIIILYSNDSALEPDRARGTAIYCCNINIRD
jgi:hypothetical protein